MLIEDREKGRRSGNSSFRWFPNNKTCLMIKRMWLLNWPRMVKVIVYNS